MDKETMSENETGVRPGMVVRLPNDSRDMTVESVEGETAICTWCENDEVIRRSYLLTLLVSPA